MGYSNDIISLNVYTNARWKKSSWGGEGDSDAGNGRAYLCGCICRDAASYISRAFFLAKYFPFFSLSTQIKKKPKLFIPHVFFFFIKKFNCYFLEITNTHVSCTTIIEQHRRHKRDDDLYSVYRINQENVFRSFRLALEDASVCDYRHA